MTGRRRRFHISFWNFLCDARTRLQLMGRLQAAVGDAERSRPRAAGEAPADDPARRRLPRGQRLRLDRVAAARRPLRPRCRGAPRVRVGNAPSPGYARGRLQSDLSKETGPGCSQRNVHAGRGGWCARRRRCRGPDAGSAVTQLCPAGPGRTRPAPRPTPRPLALGAHARRDRPPQRPHGGPRAPRRGGDDPLLRTPDARRLLPLPPARRAAVARHLRTHLRRRGAFLESVGIAFFPTGPSWSYGAAASSEGPRYEFTISSPRAPRLASEGVGQLLRVPALALARPASAKASATRSRWAKASSAPGECNALADRRWGRAQGPPAGADLRRRRGRRQRGRESGRPAAVRARRLASPASSARHASVHHLARGMARPGRRAISLAGIGGIVSTLVCHRKGCFRRGRFRCGHYRLCHVHHPVVPSDGKITDEHIAACHKQIVATAAEALARDGQATKSSSPTATTDHPDKPK